MTLNKSDFLHPEKQELAQFMLKKMIRTPLMKKFKMKWKLVLLLFTNTTKFYNKKKFQFNLSKVTKNSSSKRLLQMTQMQINHLKEE